MKLLLLGSGGREHALAWKLLQSDSVSELIWAPGQDAGVEHLETLYPEKKITRWSASLTSEPAQIGLVEKAKAYGVSLVVVGPDQLLSDGIVDRFHAAEIPTFGPTRAAARIEWSKSFAKDVMRAAQIPTAAFFTVRDTFEGEKILRSLEWSARSQWVLKADGLALGKGVEVCATLEQALQAMPRLFAYSGEVVIEERLFGQEVSWLALSDGETCALLDPARDYKTRDENGQGPNTGGMGAISPVPELPSSLREKVRREVFQPLIDEMRARGTPFQGVIYAGLMVDSRGEGRYWVLEFNARFGDPETQALLPRIDGDLLPWIQAATRPGELRLLGFDLPFTTGHAAFVVAAAPGYPEAPITGAPVTGVRAWMKSTHGFFAGLAKDPHGNFLTSGGRVFGALGFGDTAEFARKRAYLHLEMLDFEKKHYRKDVG